MKKLTAILLTLIILTITSCGEKLGGELAGNFWAQNYVTGVFYRVDAEKLAEGSKCVVWAEKGSGVTAAMAYAIANEYDSKIYVRMMNTFGYNINVQGVGIMNTMEYAHALATGKTSGAKLTILLLDIKDGYKPGVNNAYTAGYFWSGNLFKKNPSHTLLKYSNELDMIYVDTYPSVLDSTESYETFAHEMQHLMNFISDIILRSDDTDIYPTDTWINEGLSSAAEYIYSGQHLENRLKNYNEDWSGLIKKGNNFYVWNNHEGENQYSNLDDYATVYLFFQWLRLQSNSTDIYHDISISDYSNYEAVTEAAAKRISTDYGGKWQLMLRDWHAANFTNATSGRYGYKGDSKLKDVKAPMVPGGTTSLPLFPGEGVYSRTTSAETVPGTSGYIRYAGLSSTGLAPNDSTGFANGARLTYNVDTNLKSSSVSGNTTGITPSVGISVPSGSSGSVQIGSSKFTGPFKVDASYFRNKNGNSDMPYYEIRGLVNKSGNRSVSSNGGMIKFDKSTLERVFINE
jgi:hypothetical protein